MLSGYYLLDEEGEIESGPYHDPNDINEWDETRQELTWIEGHKAVTVHLLHFTTGLAFLPGFDGDADLRHAHTFVLPDRGEATLEDLFTITNVDTEEQVPARLLSLLPVNPVRAYRARRNRSTSVNDVAIIERDGEQVFYRCESLGWKRIKPVTYIDGTNETDISAAHFGWVAAHDKQNNTRRPA